MEKIRSAVTVVAVAAIVTGGISFGAYKMSQTDMFDSEGRYVKSKVESEGIQSFMEKCNTFDYDKLVKSPNDYTNKKLKFWATVIDVNKQSNGDIEYVVNFNSTDTSVRRIKLKALNKESFFRGDKVNIYGTFTNMVVDDNSKIPYMEARRLIGNNE